jgi:hypothetical protein
LSLEQIICEPLQAFAEGDTSWRRQQAATLQELACRTPSWGAAEDAIFDLAQPL